MSHHHEGRFKQIRKYRGKSAKTSTLRGAKQTNKKIDNSFNSMASVSFFLHLLSFRFNNTRRDDGRRKNKSTCV
uniref:Uncharacterized protein n=1 Tax=Noccaea caerulescens TaxID=107243 RepID=A0A1J3CSV9_NOCCA